MNNQDNIFFLKDYRQKSTEQSMSQTLFTPLSHEESTSSTGERSKNTRNIPNLIKRLNEVFTEARKFDWDGKSAKPVSDATYYNATRLLSVLPEALPSPEILSDNDGYIELEWHKDGKNFSLYVTDTNLVLYAGFYGKEDRLSGRFNYEGNFPTRIELLAKDVYREAAPERRFACKVCI